jgi:hypothetical protein
MNEERNYRIVDLWNRGYCAGEVAKDVGCTKNVVLSAIVKHRNLGDITRPMVEGYSERGRLGNIVKYGFRKKKHEAQRA